MAITKERIEELERVWDYCDLLDDDDYRDWYDELTSDEQDLIDTWDRQYRKGVLKICEDINRTMKGENHGTEENNPAGCDRAG